MNFLDAPGLVSRSGQANKTASVQFSGRPGGFLGLLTKGALLQLVTFGFYRFWLTTDLRRHLWSNTSIGGDALEYTGRGRELLIGFLFALAIIGPIFFIYFLVGIEAERARAFLSLPLYLFLYFFGQFAIYRARRYRLTRTIWRGVRFWMQGSGMAYAWKSFLWALLVGVTLGLALPWREAALERYKMQHTFYGDLQGRFVGNGWDFFKRGVWIWVLALLIPAGMIGAGFAIAMTKGSRVVDRELPAIIGGLYLLAIILAVPFYAKYKAIEMKWWVAGVRFGELSLTSGLRGRSMLWLYVKMSFFGWLTMLLVALLIAAVAWIGATALHLNFEYLNSEEAKVRMEELFLAYQIPIIVVGALFYISLLLIFGIVQRFFLMRGYWKLVAATLTVAHLEAADAVVAKGSAVSGLGEGLADGLDVAGF